MLYYVTLSVRGGLRELTFPPHQLDDYWFRPCGCCDNL